VELYKIKLEEQLKPILQKQVTAELKDQIEAKYLNYYMKNLSNLLEKNTAEEEEIHNQELNIEKLKAFNEQQKEIIAKKEKSVNKLLK
ncbi:hypothetical protein U2444_14755, partial [Listeria monocytogenes]|uniref:hypothetical protein n=1 Tax=Listeria monocytogenes TaxID=1639 RepID=UPI002FDC3F7A